MSLNKKYQFLIQDLVPFCSLVQWSPITECWGSIMRQDNTFRIEVVAIRRRIVAPRTRSKKKQFFNVKSKHFQKYIFFLELCIKDCERGISYIDFRSFWWTSICRWSCVVLEMIKSIWFSHIDGQEGGGAKFMNNKAKILVSCLFLFYNKLFFCCK